jgi:hypothetical protein
LCLSDRPQVDHNEGDRLKAFGSEAYVPVVLLKRGERSALSDSDTATLARLRPLFVVPPVEWDYDNGVPKKTVDEHVANLPEQIVQCWGTDPAFLDTMFLDDTVTASGQHPLEWIIDECRTRGLPLLPTVSCDRTAAYLAAAARVVATDGAGLCLRLPLDEWPATVGTAAIDQVMQQCGVSPDEVHLVLDLGEDVGLAARGAAAAQLRSLPYIADWRSVTVAGTAMPATMPAGAGLHVLPRGDWSLYVHLRTLAAPLPRHPSFGDYIVGGVSPAADVDPKFMNISATLRYTVSDSWLVAKGGLFKGSGGQSKGAAAVPPAAALLVGDARFFGVGHCGFEDWVVPVARGAGGGNPETWRRQATAHHLKVVTDQVASLGAPSTGP